MSGPETTKHDASGDPVRADSKPSAQQSVLAALWAQIREHKVVQWTLAYLAIAYTLLHGAEMLSEALEWPHLVIRVFTLVLMLGIPVAAVLAWYHGSRAQRRVSGMEMAILVALLLIGGTLLWNAWKQPHAHAAETALTQAPADTAATGVSQKSVAVLPFIDLSEKRDQEYFSDGLSDELIEQLGRVHGLHVPARTSSFYFKGRNATIADIGKALSVAHVLEGSVRKAGDTVRVTAELIQVGTDSHLWSETFDRKLDDIFRIQDEIAAAVVQHLKLALGEAAAQPGTTTNPQAYNLYLQARHVCERETPDDLNQAVGLFDQSIALDPGFALAYAWLGDCYEKRVANGLDTDGVGFAKARAAGERATALEPNLAEGYVVQAVAVLQHDLDWTSSTELMEKALALDPNNPAVQAAAGHLAEATSTLSASESHFRSAIDKDPLNMPYRRYLGRALYYQGRLPEAEVVLRRMIQLDPKVPVAHYELGRVLLDRGDPAAALLAFQGEPGGTWSVFGPPLAFYALHRPADVQRALDALLANSPGSEFQVAEAYAYVNQPDKAFEWLENARSRHDPGLVWTRHDPLLRSLTTDPRYKQFLASIKLEE
jgi:adenylate cyclase